MTTESRSTTRGLTVGVLLEMYRQLRTIRQFEACAIELYKGAYLGGVTHPADGQEAVSVGACFALRPDDHITTTHRGHGDIIAKGAPLDRCMAELCGRTTGLCKGKGGSMHIADFSVGVVGANGILAAALPLATGLALAFKLRGLDRVVVAFLGDGATNQGAFHESLNMAALWSTPVVFCCHNNQYAGSTPRNQHQRTNQVADFAHGYGIPGVTVDGQDVLAVYDAVREAVARARRGEGPTLVECLTYRLGAHYTGDESHTYRPLEEVQFWQARDPIQIHRDRLVALDPTLTTTLDRIDREVDAAIDAAREFALRSPEPDTASAHDDVYAEVVVR